MRRRVAGAAVLCMAPDVLETRLLESWHRNITRFQTVPCPWHDGQRHVGGRWCRRRLSSQTYFPSASDGLTVWLCPALDSQFVALNITVPPLSLEAHSSTVNQFDAFRITVREGFGS
jgi:hypothetical protein